MLARIPRYLSPLVAIGAWFLAGVTSSPWSTLLTVIAVVAGGVWLIQWFSVAMRHHREGKSWLETPVPETFPFWREEEDVQREEDESLSIQAPSFSPSPLLVIFGIIGIVILVFAAYAFRFWPLVDHVIENRGNYQTWLALGGMLLAIALSFAILILRDRIRER